MAIVFSYKKSFDVTNRVIAAWQWLLNYLELMCLHSVTNCSDKPAVDEL